MVFLISRGLFMGSVPIFNDEASYLHWGKIIFSNQGTWDYTLRLDQRPPGIAILYSPWLVWPGDPVEAGRTLAIGYSTVAFGLGLIIARKLYGESVIDWVAVVLIANPLTLFYEKMALAEPHLLILYPLLFLCCLWGPRQKWLRGVAIGGILAVGYWIKATVLLMILPMVITRILIAWRRDKSVTEALKDLVIAVVVFTLLIIPIVSHPAMQTPSERWVLTADELIQLPWGLWWDNLVRVLVWLVTLSPALLLLIVGLRTRRREGILLGMWFGLPVVLMILVTRDITSRYIVWTLPLLLIVAGVGLGRVYLKNKLLGMGMALLLAIEAVWLGVWPLNFYQTFSNLSPIKRDLSQYFEGFSSGYGVKEAADFLKRRSKVRPGVVFVRNDTGNPEGAMFVYLDKATNLRVYYLDLLPAFVRNKQFRESGLAVYFVSRGGQYAGMESVLKELARFKKPLDEEFVGVYELDIDRLSVR